MKHVKGLLKFHTCRNKSHYRRWTSLINRVGFTVGSSTRVCSNHFEHGRPSLDKPHPTLYLKGYPGISSLNEETPLKRRRIERTYKSPTKQRKAERSKEESNVSKRKRMKLHFQDLDVSSRSQHDGSLNSSLEYIQESSDDQLITPPPNSDHWYEVNQGFRDCAHCTGFTRYYCKDRIDALREKIAGLESQLHEAREKITKLKEEVDYLKSKPFQLEDIEHDDNLVELYTGLPNTSMFHFLLSKLLPKTEKLQYYKGANSHTVKDYQAKENLKKPGRKRTTTPAQEMFLTLCRLRQNLSEEDISYRFKMSVGNVSTILSTWITFLARELEGLICWPTREKVLKFYPDCFTSFPDVCSIIDCAEIYLQRPSLAEAQVLTYSNYKSHNT